MDKDVIIITFRYLRGLNYWFKYAVRYLKEQGCTNFKAKYTEGSGRNIIINDLPIEFIIDPDEQRKPIELCYTGYRNPKFLRYAEFAFEKDFEGTFEKLLLEE